jgi:hypothetical protein
MNTLSRYGIHASTRRACVEFVSALCGTGRGRFRIVKKCPVPVQGLNRQIFSGQSRIYCRPKQFYCRPRPAAQLLPISPDWDGLVRLTCDGSSASSRSQISRSTLGAGLSKAQWKRVSRRRMSTPSTRSQKRSSAYQPLGITRTCTAMQKWRSVISGFGTW